MLRTPNKPAQSPRMVSRLRHERVAMSHSEVFIIGAGPAGLTSSYLLTKQGISTTVIEADPVYVGGISRTANYKDYLFDIGGHRFFSKSKEVVDLWKEILPQDFISRPRLSRIYYDGKYYSYPLKGTRKPWHLRKRAVRSVVCLQAGLPQRKARHIPRVGVKPVRRTFVLDLLQDLY
jgi:monoamine oxidase